MASGQCGVCSLVLYAYLSDRTFRRHIRKFVDNSILVIVKAAKFMLEVEKGNYRDPRGNSFMSLYFIIKTFNAFEK